MQVLALRRRLGVEVSGGDAKRPCVSFAYFGFADVIMKAIQRQGFSQPTPIQAQVCGVCGACMSVSAVSVSVSVCL